MTNVLTLICNPETATLDTTVADKYYDALHDAGLRPAAPIWLAAGEAMDLPFSGSLDTARETLTPLLQAEALDYAIQPQAERRKQLLIADMDSTIIQVECIDELADFAGLKEKVAAITEAAMRGELDFAAALKERVSLLKGIDIAVLDRVFHERVRLTPGAVEMVQTMNKTGAMTILVSGGFTFFTHRVAEATGFQVNRGNVLGISNGKLSGEVVPPIVDSSTKLNSLIEFRQSSALTPRQTLAVGDGANDIPMIQEAGLGVAYHPKPAAAAAADVVIRYGDLTALLYLQGFHKEEFVTA
ncbi:phosphoserine phosphatase SerB [Luteithermobacter gelatinilyticus]|uniref:phosphoserine phosphatase SerB n=1 Tax=Luteithermobacter gelatinilyticus TaxID=2582913 RepID=UPI0011068E9A|nr:phosphoserine phosphatase SerB [Luteithermobacter gelatinilyticus]